MVPDTKEWIVHCWKLPLSVKLESVTSVGEDFFPSTLSNFCKKKKKIIESMGNKSLIHAILYYTASGFFWTSDAGIYSLFRYSFPT